MAFDYSYDHTGRLVVWEGNPFPHIQFGSHHRQYRWPAVERGLAAMTRLYFSARAWPFRLKSSDLRGNSRFRVHQLRLPEAWRNSTIRRDFLAEPSPFEMERVDAL